jgi:putative membrane protein
MRQFIAGTIVTAIAFYILTKFLPHYVKYDGELVGLIVIAIIFGIVNGLIGPIVRLLAFPISFMTMGLFGFVVNALLLLVTALVATKTGFDLSVGGFPDAFGIDAIVAAVIGSIVLSVVSTVVGMVVPAD